MSYTITATRRKRRLGAEQHRALQLLASTPFGATEAIMLVHGFTRRMLARLVRTGLAAVRSEVVKVGSRPIEVGRVRITAAGRRALEG
jgi:hypothetical protein